MPHTAAVTVRTCDLRQLFRLWVEIVKIFDGAPEISRTIRCDVRVYDDSFRRLLPGSLPLDGYWTLSARELRELSLLTTRVSQYAQALYRGDAIGVHVRAKGIQRVISANLQMELPLGSPKKIR